ncbi:hypothetical protein FQA39_LY07656 [Lamprigera yunnana]|nr:hypothetical protein FQA39_LY07656 [Lamprigera yunnana]
MGIQKYNAAVKDVLSQDNMRCSLEIARRYVNEPLEFCNGVIFSEDKIFNSGNDGPVKVFRPERTRYEYNYVKKTVHLMEDLETAVGQYNLAYKQIDLFALQVYVEDFKFSVFGCFPLDWTLLHSMAAGIATYLVIFYQFSNMEKNI